MKLTIILSLLAGLGFGIFDLGIPNPNLGVFQMPVGAGLQVTSLDVECDSGYQGCGSGGTSTMVARTDTGNGWYYNPNTTNCGNANRTGCWQPLVTKATMPNGTTTPNGTNVGLYEVVIAPSNTNDFYMIWSGDGCFYSSTNKGSTWTKGGNIIGSGCTASDSNQSTKFYKPYIAVDPQNTAVVLASTPNSGASYSTNSGSTWTHITALGSGGVNSGVGDSQGGGTIFAYDPSSSVSGGQKQGIYACTWGTGVFHTTTGPGGTWSAVNGTNEPNACYQITVDPTGLVWVVVYNGSTGFTVWSCNATCQAGGAWHNESTSSSNWNSITVDTNHCATAGACRVLITDQGGAYQYTITGSNGWGAYITHANNAGTDPQNGYVATDQPWLEYTNQGNWQPGGMMFDPAQSSVAMMTIGVGVLSFSPTFCSSSCSQFQGTSVTAAMELGNTNWITGPPNGSPIVVEWDRTGFVLSSQTQYPTRQICRNVDPFVEAGSVIAGWSVDWVSNTPADIVAICNFSSTDLSGISTDHGATWSQFATQPAGGLSGSLVQGGCITATTPSNILFEDGSGSGFYVSTNGGSTWSSIVQPGGLTSGWGRNRIGGHSPCASDRVNGKFYVFNGTSSTDHFFSCSSSCGTAGNWTQTCTACAGGGSTLFGSQGGGAVNLRTINGQANTIFAFVGFGPPNASAYKSTDGGATWTALTNVTAAVIGEGASCPGDSAGYELYLYGGITGNGTGFGLYHSGDGGSTWTQLEPTGLSNSLAVSLDYIKTLTGDDAACGTVYLGTGNMGVVRVKWR